MNDMISLEIPKELENLQLPNPTLLDHYKDAESRTFWLEGEVCFETLELVKTIMRINHEDTKYQIPAEERMPIKIFIDTPGGHTQVMRSLIGAIKISKTPVYTIVYCSAMSAGSYILAAGHKRFAFPNSVILVHSGNLGYQGTVEQVESAKKFYDKLDKNDNDAFLSYTNVVAKDLKKKGAVDWYMTAEEALKYGIIDRIIEDFDEVM